MHVQYNKIQNTFEEMEAEQKAKSTFTSQQHYRQIPEGKMCNPGSSREGSTRDKGGKAQILHAEPPPRDGIWTLQLWDPCVEYSQHPWDQPAARSVECSLVNVLKWKTFAHTAFKRVPQLDWPEPYSSIPIQSLQITQYTDIVGTMEFNTWMLLKHRFCSD